MQTGTDPEKRSIGKGKHMKLNWLKEMIGEGYTEETDEKVCQAMGRTTPVTAEAVSSSVRKNTPPSSSSESTKRPVGVPFKIH